MVAVPRKQHAVILGKAVMDAVLTHTTSAATMASGVAVTVPSVTQRTKAADQKAALYVLMVPSAIRAIAAASYKTNPTHAVLRRRSAVRVAKDVVQMAGESVVTVESGVVRMETSATSLMKGVSMLVLQNKSLVLLHLYLGGKMPATK